MNWNPRVLVAVGLAWMCAVGSARGQTAGPTTVAALRKPPLPLQLKSAVSVTAADATTINTTVAGNFAAMLDTNPAVQQSAREAIILDSRGAGPVSAAFSDAYAQAVVTNLMTPAIANAKPIRVRLNAAIALARVSESLGNAKLEPAVLLFLAEGQPYALRLWGVKAAKGILPELAKTNAGAKVLAAVLAAVKKHPTGAMAAEAYDALQAKSGALINALLQVIDFRVQLYRKGLPEDPQAEKLPFAFFTKLEIWTSLTPTQRLKVMQAVCDVLVLAAYHGDAQPAGPGPREVLHDVLKAVCSSLQVAAQPEILENKDLETAALAALRLLQNSSVNFAQAVKELPAAIRKIKGYVGVTEPKLVPPPSTNPIVVSN